MVGEEEAATSDFFYSETLWQNGEKDKFWEGRRTIKLYQKLFCFSELDNKEV